MNILKSIEQGASEGNGTNQYYHRHNKSAVYTDGVKEFLLKAECQWLYDIIESEVYIKTKCLCPEIYYLNVISMDDEVDLILKTYQDDEIWSRHIEFSDLPQGNITLDVGWDGERQITCLSSEN
jgi:hypothetical protein